MFNLQVLMYDNEDLTINRAASVVKKTRANFVVMINRTIVSLFLNLILVDYTNTLCCDQSQCEIFKTIVGHNA